MYIIQVLQGCTDLTLNDFNFKESELLHASLKMHRSIKWHPKIRPGLQAMDRLDNKNYLRILRDPDPQHCQLL
jgi:hypothetical protein